MLSWRFLFFPPFSLFTRILGLNEPLILAINLRHILEGGGSVVSKVQDFVKQTWN